MSENLPSAQSSRSKRPIVPELRDVPLTFLDCDLARRRVDFNNVGWDGCADVCGSCQLIRELGKCPRGFAA